MLWTIIIVFSKTNSEQGKDDVVVVVQLLEAYMRVLGASSAADIQEAS